MLDVYILLNIMEIWNNCSADINENLIIIESYYKQGQAIHEQIHIGLNKKVKFNSCFIGLVNLNF